jgi:hypothetical protein
VPALEPYLIEPIWQQFEALLPQRRTDHPLGCHHSGVPESGWSSRSWCRFFGLRLRLPQDRRGILLGEHPSSQAR